MRPDENDNQRVGKPLINQRPILYDRDAPVPQVPSRDTSSRNSAANLVRGQIDEIYSGKTHTPTPQTTPVIHESHTKPQTDQLKIESPYDRVHSQTPQPQADQWKQYHSAWQNYYKQYYERHYINELYKTQQTGQKPVETTAAASNNQAVTPEADKPQSIVESVSKNQALLELRDDLRQKITESARKVRKSHHFLPITAGVVVLLLFSFLQYNRTIFATASAYISPGNIDPQNIIVDPTVSVEVGPEPKLIIPKINVEVPVVYGVGADHDSQMKAMESGVAHFAIPGANSVPGQVGNTVIAGHSSNDVFAAGDYKFIFAQNEKLVEGDTIYMNYNGVRYIYKITSREVVMPNEVGKIILDTDKPMLTLISCVPLGTADKRLLIFAEQISPAPEGAQAAPAESDSAETAADTNIPGEAPPTFLEKLFGA